jgi:hypothetical protein
MNKFLIVIISLYIITCPFYVFDSGLPQPSDGIAFMGILSLLFSGKIYPLLKLKVFKRLIQFIILATIINLIYFFIYRGKGINNKFYFPPLFYIFNMLFFCMVFYLLNKNFLKNANFLSLAILISLFVQVLFGIGHIGGGRSSLFFNNPNQLGYYSLVSLSIFSALPSKYRANKLIFLVTVLMSAYLILLSNSRAALLGVALLGIIVFIKEGFKVKASSMFFAVTALMLGWYFLSQSVFVDTQIKTIKDRAESKVIQGVSEWQIRGYDRFYLNPEYIFFGAGEGAFERFNSYQHLEMHSGPGTILFSYGIAGFLIFFSFIKFLIRRNVFYNLILLTPVFLYNLSHQGFRESLFWILLASVFVVSEKEHIFKLNKLTINRSRVLAFEGKDEPVTETLNPD